MTEHRGWRERLGLRPGRAAPDPGKWVELAEGGVDSATGSEAAAALVARLGRAGIEARERPYVPSDPYFTLSGGPEPEQRVRFAVLVHRADRARAAEILAADAPPPISEAELDRQAEAAPAPPSDETDGLDAA